MYALRAGDVLQWVQFDEVIMFATLSHSDFRLGVRADLLRQHYDGSLSGLGWLEGSNTFVSTAADDTESGYCFLDWTW